MTFGFNSTADDVLADIDLTGKNAIVTGSNQVVCLEVHDTRMVGEVGFDRRIMTVFDRHNVSYISKMTNANTIDLIILERDGSPHLLAQLSDSFENVSAQALAKEGINILAVSQTSRQTNMQFIVDRSQFAAAQRALHAALCM